MEPKSMPSLPEELITKILLKLPVKSLLQLRCISKSWLSLIGSPHFVKSHLLIAATDKDYTHYRVIFDVYHRVIIDAEDRGIKDCSLSSLLHDSAIESFDLDYPSKGPRHYPEIVGSFNGLICLAISVDRCRNFFLWNPSIRKYYALPDYRLSVTRLCHEDGYIYHGSRFVYDEFQDDYKLVCIFGTPSPKQLHHLEVKIYSLKSNSWRHIHGFQGYRVRNQPGKLVNGKLHWFNYYLNIVFIDLASEKWVEVEQPCYFESYDNLVLGVLGSDLSLVYDPWDHVDIWVMKEYGVKESWTIMFTIKSDFLEHRFRSPIFMSNEDEILLQGSRLTIYNPKDDSIRYLDVTNIDSWFKGAIYVKSLIWPFGRENHECNNGN